MNIPVLIPAYNPGQSLIDLVDGLIQFGFQHIIVVNDGSKPDYLPIFALVEQRSQCRVLHHAVNCGKGRALKTGLNYFYLNFPHSIGIVTADADGQHHPSDILKIAQAFPQHPDKLIIGSRKMSRDIPFRSLFGNMLTRWIFAMMTGKIIRDTQSGLRGIPRSLIPRLLTINGERYEFEINMLILTKQNNIPVVEIPITTIYIENNKSSHFNPFYDSMRIYFQLFRFTFSSLLASVLDFIIFTILFQVSQNLIMSLLAGRFVVGSLVNYVINKRFVFHSHAAVWRSLLKYYFALSVMSFFSYLLITVVRNHIDISVSYAKIGVETLLFFFSFMIQREFVFSSKNENE